MVYYVSCSNTGRSRTHRKRLYKYSIGSRLDGGGGSGGITHARSSRSPPPPPRDAGNPVAGSCHCLCKCSPRDRKWTTTTPPPPLAPQVSLNRRRVRIYRTVIIHSEPFLFRAARARAFIHYFFFPFRPSRSPVSFSNARNTHTHRYTYT